MMENSLKGNVSELMDRTKLLVNKVEKLCSDSSMNSEEKLSYLNYLQNSFTLTGEMLMISLDKLFAEFVETINEETSSLFNDVAETIGILNGWKIRVEQMMKQIMLND